MRAVILVFCAALYSLASGDLIGNEGILEAEVIEQDGGQYVGPLLRVPRHANTLVPISKSMKIRGYSSEVQMIYLTGLKRTTLSEMPAQPESSGGTFFFFAFLAFVAGVVPVFGLADKGDNICKKAKGKSILFALFFASVGLALLYCAAVEDTRYATLWIDNAGSAEFKIAINDELRAELEPGTHCRLTVRLHDSFNLERPRPRLVSLVLEPRNGQMKKEDMTLKLEHDNIYLYNIDSLNRYSLQRVSYR
jgi:hypothetical protein